MQDPNEDTEWNDILRAKGILPPKEPEITEEALVDMIDQSVQEHQSEEYRLGKLSLDELDELEDDEDFDIIQKYRQKRMEEIKRASQKRQFSEIEEITAKDYVSKVNEAGEGIWVVLHLYKPGIVLCTLINQHLATLCAKFPAVRFLKAISTTCIPNFPDFNLPAIFVYFEGQMKEQIVGADRFGNQALKCDDLEWILARTGAFMSELEEDPRTKVDLEKVKSTRVSKRSPDDDDSDEDDW